MKKIELIKSMLLVICLVVSGSCMSQPSDKIKWSIAGNSFYDLDEGSVWEFTLPAFTRQLVLPKEKLIPAGRQQAIRIEDYQLSPDNKLVLVFANATKVWRYKTRGDYWLYNKSTATLRQLGKKLPVASLMFAKFSPDGTRVAYVSAGNLYMEDVSSGQVKQLTFDGQRKLINGTFDWAYEEEFFCRDGFRWSPDSKKIAFWQIDARKVKDYLMINNVDSIYPFVTPVEYPVAGQSPSPYKIGVINTATAKTTWMAIPGDPSQHYVPRMEWAANSTELILQQLNRKQNESKIMLCTAATGAAKTIYTEKDSAWIDILPLWDADYTNGGWDWLKNGQEFLWPSEKDGWRHLYRVNRQTGKEVLVTNGAFDVMDICRINEKDNLVYFMASPQNATQKYLYRTALDGKGQAELVSPVSQQGTHNYDFSPDATIAFHTFSNYRVRPASEWITVTGHKPIAGQRGIDQAIIESAQLPSNMSFFKVKTNEGVEMDGWMVKPANFDSTRKYPVVFLVYTEPWGQEVKDEFGVGVNALYKGNMSADGYIYMALDNRGTPVPKGRAWRKSVYRKIGLVNIRDQAMGAKEILKWRFVDSSRIAVWGWSGGGAATLNLLFQYPEIYKTGIAIAAVGNQLTYDNIYQERYMGLPEENRQDFINGSPITYAKNLKGNLLYIHGSGDDNVHYQNAEMLVNELIKYNKQFELMVYPNRTHSISEGVGTSEHLKVLYTNFLKKNMPPGGR